MSQELLKNRLKILRAERNISQEELAQAVEVSRQTINAIENSRFIPSAYLALKIAKYFNVTFEEVFSF